MGMMRLMRSGPMLAPCDEHFDDGPAVGGKAEVDRFGGGIVLRGVDLDFSLHPLLALVVLEHAGQGAIAGVVVHVGAGSQVGVAAELRHAHAGVAGDLDLAHARLRAGDRLEGDIDELLVGVRGERRA